MHCACVWGGWGRRGWSKPVYALCVCVCWSKPVYALCVCVCWSKLVYALSVCVCVCWSKPVYALCMHWYPTKYWCLPVFNTHTGKNTCRSLHEQVSLSLWFCYMSPIYSLGRKGGTLTPSMSFISRAVNWIWQLHKSSTQRCTSCSLSLVALARHRRLIIRCRQVLQKIQLTGKPVMINYVSNLHCWNHAVAMQVFSKTIVRPSVRKHCR